MPSVCRYRGNQVDNLREQAAAGHLFGPDICGAPARGEILGRGAYYELVGATYDADSDTTTATFRPYVPPTQRGRIRYYGGDYAEVDPPTAPTLADRDTIRGQ